MISLRDQPRRELGGPDPLDRRIGAPPLTALQWLRSTLFTRSALGLAPSLTPAVVFLPLGAILGPRGLQWFTPQVLTRLDTAVTIALAVLGVMVGVALARGMREHSRLLAAASLESAVTVAAVAGATAYFVVQTGIQVGAPLGAIALAFGICASASSATSASPDSEAAAAVGTRVADLDDVLPIVLTTVAVPLMLTESAQDTWILIGATIATGLTVGAIGWLLFDRAESGAERVVFVLGAMALAGGAAAYLQVSPLAVGLIAGMFWVIAPGLADRVVIEDLGRVQHPLVVLLLLTAGALWAPSVTALWLLAPYVLFRLAGKCAGAWATARFLEVRAGDLAAFLMPPGVLAVAFALNVRQLLPPEAGQTLISVVAVGTAAFELFALAVVPRWRRSAGRGPDPSAGAAGRGPDPSAGAAGRGRERSL